MIFGIALATPEGTAGAIFYVAHHITIQTALFLITGLVERLAGTTSLDRLGGLAVASPVLAMLFFVPAMNLAGIPPLSGFLAKIGLLQAGHRARHAARVAARRRRHRDEPADALRPDQGLEPGVLAHAGRRPALRRDGRGPRPDGALGVAPEHGPRGRRPRRHGAPGPSPARCSGPRPP